MVFVDLFAGGGRSTAAAVTLDTVADESKNKMAGGVTRSPSRLRSRDGKICCYGDALSTILLLLCLAACFSFFFYIFLFSPASQYAYVLRVPLSVQQPSATLSRYVFYIYSACCFCSCHCILPHLGILLFFIRLVFFSVALISGVAFLLLLCSRTRYAST